MTYKILSLDGGGFRGVMSARILKAVEEKLDRPLHEYFDLVAGTSTGSILAAGIALGKTADELLNLYKRRGQEIFPDRIRSFRNLTRISRGFFPVNLYPHGVPGTKKKGLSTVLQEELGDTKIVEVEKPVLVIPAYNTLDRRTWWFVSNNPPSAPQWYDNIPIWELSSCSASAPTFFPPYDLEVPQPQLENQLIAGQKYSFIDGGVAANNPALIAISHALFRPTEIAGELKDLSLRDISILSIGTGKPTQPFSYQQVKSWGMMGWAVRLGDLFIPAPNGITESVCWQIIREQDDENAKRVLRLDFDIDTRKEEDKVLETIDDPHLYDRFIQVTENYLQNAKARVGKDKKIAPIDAISQFIANNP
ncbi:MAG: patatin-like phospholipase family protein [Cyanobacteria bacterium P01_E01_bin.42]